MNKKGFKPVKNSHSKEFLNSADYLSWKRLHMSRSKLKGAAEMSSFMACFAVSATVELQINDDDIQPPLLVAFVVSTALLVGTSLLAIMLSTWILPHFQSIIKTTKVSSVEVEIGFSPHDQMMTLIDTSWILTNSASLFFFTLNFILMCWIKYKVFSMGASIAATVIMAPALVVIVAFAVYSYRKLVTYQYNLSTIKCQEMEDAHKELSRVSSVYSMTSLGGRTPNIDRKFYHHYQDTGNHPHRFQRE